ncbi:RNA-binding protein [Dirofilaria immitis]
MAFYPQPTSTTTPTSLIPFALRTSGCNATKEQGSDSAPVQTIAFIIIDHQCATNIYNKVNTVEELDVNSLGLQAALRKVENAVPNDSVLVTNGISAIRQVLHPLALRLSFTLSPLFYKFIDISRFEALPVDGNCSLKHELDLIRKTIQYLCEGTRDLIGSIEDVKTELRNAICLPETPLVSEVIVRARGLPWQATDHDIAQFFIGLNIAPGGVALCLSPEGRRNGEALVRFEDSNQRELALKRHRHFLHNRYIEVYRATGNDFLQVAADWSYATILVFDSYRTHHPFSIPFSELVLPFIVPTGSNSEAVHFVSRGSTGVMIVRMRGLPYDCTEAQILEFFAEGENGCKVTHGGILFVNKSDGRPTGDAFVMFDNEEAGQKALTKHKRTIGTRYIELFRSTQAEVQQVVNRNLENDQRMMVHGSSKKDCIRLRGLPYEAHVENIVDFLGETARHIMFQVMHMVYNAQGHPSGEAFIQMDSEMSAATAAALAHNKYMQIGKKQRYIEVFQCSPEDMNLVLTNPPLPPQFILQPRPLFPQQTVQNLVPAIVPPFSPLYWPCLNSPASPCIYPLQSQSGLVLVTGLCPNITPQDILAYFQTNPEIVIESVQMLRWGTSQYAGEALVRFRSRMDAERALAEHVSAPLDKEDTALDHANNKLHR